MARSRAAGRGRGVGSRVIVYALTTYGFPVALAVLAVACWVAILT